MQTFTTKTIRDIALEAPQTTRVFEEYKIDYCCGGRKLLQGQDFVLGQIALRNQRTAEVYLYDPPLYIGKHWHGRCMQLLTPGGKWFRLHFEKPATSFGDAYTFVEHMLTEAFNLTH